MKNIITKNEQLEDEYAWWVLRFINVHNNNSVKETRLSLDQHPIFHCKKCDNVWNSRRVTRIIDKKKKYIDLQTNYSMIPKPEKKKICRKCKIPSTEVESY